MNILNAYLYFFDADWYLKNYPDVLKAKVDPFVHFKTHGINEGRLPCNIDAIEWEKKFLGFNDQQSYKLLINSTFKNTNLTINNIYSSLILARWHSSYGRWPETYDCIKRFKSFKYSNHIIQSLAPDLLEFSCLINMNKLNSAKQLIEAKMIEKGELNDLLLAESSLYDSNQGLDFINIIFHKNKLLPIILRNNLNPKILDNITYDSKDINYSFISRLFKPKVSIIMPVFNAEKTITTAIESLCEQTWINIEIIIIDDASTDNTVKIVARHSAKDDRIKVIKNDYNQGAYSSRNKGLEICSGNYITVHDSDDWSHPQKIEMQVKALINNKNIVASMSHMVRCTDNMYFYHWHIKDSWIYLNTSSLMFKRIVFKTLGFWDRIKVGGDSEYYRRILTVFGVGSIKTIYPGVPLSFARINKNSLSQNHKTHLRTLYNGLRKDYNDAYSKWQIDNTISKQLYLPINPQKRPFPIPQFLAVPPHEDTVKNHYLLIQKSKLFSVNWYKMNYPDIALSGDNPLMHYILHGGYEGRDPGPNFTSSGYTHLYLQEYPEIINPLAHYLTVGHKKENQPLPLIEGSIVQDKSKKTILICAHSSGKQIFGAERSLLDILNGIISLDFNVVVTIPKISNLDYLNTLREHSCYVKVFPYSWWKQGNQQVNETVSHFNELISKLNIDAVYANTLMLWEPLISSRIKKIPNYIHIRELPVEDLNLCNVLNAEPDEIRNHVHELADNIIANSKAVANYFNLPDKTYVVHNFINIDQFDMVNVIQNGNMVIAMISSNLPKKGIEDFILMAKRLSAINSNIECILIGPDNVHVQELLQNEKPDNLQISGYLSSPQEAISKANIIVNLSHVQESFGRTILEAMAARRCVIGYDWGALPELIKDGENGYLVPYRDIQSLVDKVLYLKNNPDMIIRLGQKGRKMAEENYDINQFNSQLNLAFNSLM